MMALLQFANMCGLTYSGVSFPAVKASKID